MAPVSSAPLPDPRSSIEISSAPLPDAKAPLRSSDSAAEHSASEAPAPPGTVATQLQRDSSIHSIRFKLQEAARLSVGGWMDIPEDEKEVKDVEARYGAHSMQARVLHAVHSLPCQLVGILLLIADVVILVVEVDLAIEYPACAKVQRYGSSCCAGAGLDGNSGGCAAGLTIVPENALACDPHLERAELKFKKDVLFWSSVTIGFLFAFEMLVVLLIVGVRTFVRNPLYVFDTVVIATTLTLEITLHNLHLDGHAALSGLLVLSRLWRLVRIAHGFILVSKRKETIQLQVSRKFSLAPSPAAGPTSAFSSARSVPRSVKALLDEVDAELSQIDLAGGSERREGRSSQL